MTNPANVTISFGFSESPAIPEGLEFSGPSALVSAQAMMRGACHGVETGYRKTDVCITVGEPTAEGLNTVATRFDLKAGAEVNIRRHLETELAWKAEQVATGGTYARFIRPESLVALETVLAAF